MKFPFSLGQLFKPATKTAPTEDDANHFENELQHSWSITARVASLSPEIVSSLPAEVASLVAEAKGLHPQVAIAASSRLAPIQNNPIKEPA